MRGSSMPAAFATIESIVYWPATKSTSTSWPVS